MVFSFSRPSSAFDFFGTVDQRAVDTDFDDFFDANCA